ncbi:MAG: hypothetical protein M1827_002093 [Pycnora praestabilis]|nr:MAG: hypothetical protein M1827_002093 [Pycnora praestabilis]
MNPNDSQRNERHRDDRRYVFNNRTNSRYSRNADLIQAARVGPVNEDVVEPMQIELALYQSSSAPSDPPIDAFQMAYRPMTSSAGDPTNQFNLSAWDGVPSPHAQPNYSHPHLGLFSTPPAPAYSSATAHTSPPVYSSTEGSNFPTRFLSINLPYPHVNHPQGYLPNGMEWSSNVVQPNYGPIRETIHDGQDAYHGQDAHAGQNAHHGQDAHDEKDTHDEHDKHDEHDEDDSYDQYAAWDGRSFDTAFTSPREFKKIVRGYILDLSHKKQDKALIWGRRVEDIRQVLLDTKSTKVESAQFR